MGRLIRIRFFAEPAAPDAQVRVDAEVPVSRILPALLKRFGLPAARPDGTPAEYALFHLDGDQTLSETQSLAASGVSAGDHVQVRLKPPDAALLVSGPLQHALAVLDKLPEPYDFDTAELRDELKKGSVDAWVSLFESAVLCYEPPKIGPITRDDLDLLAPRILEVASPDAVPHYLGMIGDHRLVSSLKQVIARLADPSPETRKAALGALEQMQAREAVGAILPLFRDPDKDVRERAVVAARNLDERSA